MPQDISANIADMDKWPEFTGYGMLPGIKNAQYEVRKVGMVGSRIRVENTDGSMHTEKILTWRAEKEILMELCEFSPPLNKMASHFLETWTFEEKDDGTQVTRAFTLYPTTILTQPALWLISLMFRRAIKHHLHLMAQDAPTLATKTENP